MIKEVAIIEVHPGKNNKPDCFTALIKAMGIELTTEKIKDTLNYSDQVHEFTEEWFLFRQGDWWILNDIKSKKYAWD